MKQRLYPDVITIRETCFLFRKARNTVIMACLAGRLAYRKADLLWTDRGVYLIYTASAIKLWGEPENEL